MHKQWFIPLGFFDPPSFFYIQNSSSPSLAKYLKVPSPPPAKAGGLETMKFLQFQSLPAPLRGLLKRRMGTAPCFMDVMTCQFSFDLDCCDGSDEYDSSVACFNTCK